MNNRGIRFRVLLLALLPLVLVAAGLTAYFSLARYDEMDRALEERTLAIAGQLAQSCELALFSGDMESLDHLARPVAKVGDIQGVIIADQDGRSLVRLGSSRFSQDWRVRESMVASRDEGAILVVAPVIQQVMDIEGFEPPAEISHLGYVALEVSRQSTRERQHTMLVTGLAIAVLGLFLAGMLAWRLGRDIVRPLAMLTDAVERIGAGDLNARVQVDSGGEFAVLEQCVNHMAAELKASYDTLQEKVRAATAKLSWQASHDSLTGLLNHTSFKERLRVETARHNRLGKHLAVGLLDIDDFKSVNDTHGHPVGDRVIKNLARLLIQRAGSGSILGRYGGEEFAMVLPDTSLEDARSRLESIRSSFATIEQRTGRLRFNCTFSCGLAGLSRQDDAEALIMAADQALYRAKRGGKNRVEIAGGAG